MKKSHLILITITVFISLFSAYTLAATNTASHIVFSVYSKESNKFEKNILHDFKNDNWKSKDEINKIEFGLINDKKDLDNFCILVSNDSIEKKISPDEMMLYCSIRKVYSKDYSVKFIDMAQRGDIVEVKININSPKADHKYESLGLCTYSCSDLIKFEKKDIIHKGQVKFIFKDQFGTKLYGDTYQIQ